MRFSFCDHLAVLDSLDESRLFATGGCVQETADNRMDPSRKDTSIKNDIIMHEDPKDNDRPEENAPTTNKLGEFDQECVSELTILLELDSTARTTFEPFTDALTRFDCGTNYTRFWNCSDCLVSQLFCA